MASIEPFIHHKVVVLHQDDPIKQAAKAMAEHRIGCVLVADRKGHLLGIVTDRDLVCHAGSPLLNGAQKIEEVMTKSLVTIDEYAKVEDVVNLMETYGIRRIPVIHRVAKNHERCIGVITLDDLIASRSIEYSRLSRVVQSQIFRRKSAIFGKTEAIRARARASARSEETLRNFYRVVAEKIGLSVDRAEPVAQYILGALVQRLHYTGAAHIIAQLPLGLQDSLLDLPAGPDRTITVESVVTDLTQRFGFDQGFSQAVLPRFWGALRDLVDPRGLNHVRVQLPADFKDIFAPVDFPEAGTDHIAA